MKELTLREAIAAYVGSLGRDGRSRLEHEKRSLPELPDEAACRRALAILDDLHAPPRWDLAWAFAHHFPQVASAMEWYRSGWTNAYEASHAARVVGADPAEALRLLERRGLTLEDVEAWSQWVGVAFPWSDEDWTMEAEALMVAVQSKGALEPQSTRHSPP